MLAADFLPRFPIFNDRHDVPDVPKPLGYASGHRRRAAQRAMNADKIVSHEVQRDHVGVVLDLLEKPFVSSVKRRMCIRIVRLARSA